MVRLRQILGLIGCLLVSLPEVRADVVPRCDNNKSPSRLVTGVYPTSSELPANLLRFYVYFSRPMTGEDLLLEAYIEDANEQMIDGVLFSSRFALWSPDKKRLTLLLDPGRVKTGLDSHQTLGRALEVGENYSLTIKTSQTESNGCQLTVSHSKRFTIGEADVDIPNLSNWSVARPSVASRDPLVIALNGPHDHLSLAYRVRVHNAQGLPIPGSIRLNDNEQEWWFTPNKAWADQLYKITVDPALEDIAGNRVTGLFDDPTGENRTNRPTPKLTEIRFRPDS